MTKIYELSSSDRIYHKFDSHEFACGCGAAFINIAVTYPIYKLIFRQMLHGVNVNSAYKQLRNEGFVYLYRGIFPPMAQKMVSLSIMFGVYDGIKRHLVEDLAMNVYLAKIVAGVSSGSAECLLLPFERVQTLLADSKFHQHFQNSKQAVGYVVSHHGYSELYRGIYPVLLRNGPTNAIFFILREEASAHLPKTKSQTSKTIQEFFAGAIIGASISTLFYPLNVIKIAMQSQMGHKSDTIWTVGKRIYEERGNKVRYFYRGCGFNVSRSFISWGIMNTAYEHLKEIIC